MVNDLTLIGHICANIELKHLENGTPVCSVSLATNKTWKDANGEKQEDTQFHNLVFWRANAENAANWLKKGSLIYVKGEISYRDYEKDGVKRYQTDITVLTFRKLEKSEKSSDNFPSTEPPQNQRQAQKSETPKENEDNLFDEPVKIDTPYSCNVCYKVTSGKFEGKEFEIKSITEKEIVFKFITGEEMKFDKSTFDEFFKICTVSELPF